jgi:hypothetical protein
VSFLHFPEGLAAFRRPALVAAHPGHEVSVFGWLTHARPRVHLLTDGSGLSGVSRLASSQALLRDVEAAPGEVFGVGPDRTFYRAIRDRDAAFFLGIVDALANALVRDQIDVVVGDAAEGYDPNHDLCRVMIDAAVSIARHHMAGPIAKYQFAFGAWLLPVAQPHDRACLHVELGEALFRRKLKAARDYPGLGAEVSRALAAVGEEFFRVECLRPVAEASPDEQPASKPYYELMGEQRLTEGAVGSVIRYKDHVAPLVAAIGRHAVVPGGRL